MTPVEIKLYQTASEPTMVEKTLVEKATVTGFFKQVQDITAPVIDLAFNDRDTFNLYFNSNYAYIALFNRYYFISRKEVGMNNILSIYMDEDVLMSFKNEIYELTPFVLRQEQEFSSDLFDNALIPSLKPYYEEKELTISYPKIIGNSAVRTIEYNSEDIVTFCQIESGDTSCVAVKVFSNANTGTKYESKWVQNGGSYINRTYFENIDMAAEIVDYMAGSDVWKVLASMFVSIDRAINFVKILPFDAYKAGLGLIATDSISIIGVRDKTISSPQNYMDTQNAFLVLPIEPIEDLIIRPTKSYFDYEYSLKLTLPFIGTVEIPFIQLINLEPISNEIALFPYIIINTSNLQGKIYILRQKLACQYILQNAVYEYQGIVDITPKNIIFESDLFPVGISMPLGSTNSAQFQIAAAVKGVKAVGGVVKALSKILA